jgi:hypothetical protein
LGLIRPLLIVAGRELKVKHIKLELLSLKLEQVEELERPQELGLLQVGQELRLELVQQQAKRPQELERHMEWQLVGRMARLEVKLLEPELQQVIIKELQVLELPRESEHLPMEGLKRPQQQ